MDKFKKVKEVEFIHNGLTHNYNVGDRMLHSKIKEIIIFIDGSVGFVTEDFNALALDGEISNLIVDGKKVDKESLKVAREFEGFLGGLDE